MVLFCDVPLSLEPAAFLVLEFGGLKAPFFFKCRLAVFEDFRSFPFSGESIPASYDPPALWFVGQKIGAIFLLLSPFPGWIDAGAFGFRTADFPT